MQRGKPRGGDDGVSLVELLVALTFLAGVMLALTHASISGLSSVKSASDQVAADQVVDDTVENLKAQPWTSIVPPGTTMSYNLTPATVARGGNSYAITGAVTWMDDPCNGSATSPVDATRDYLQIDVTATWTVQTRTKTHRVVTYKTPALADKAPARVSSAC